MNTSAPTTSLSPVLGRVFWAMFGPLLLMLTAIKIGRNADGWLAPSDVVFLVLIAGVCFARWLEFRGGDPRTATGNPADAGHLRRFYVGAVAVGGALWIAANVMGNHVLG